MPNWPMSILSDIYTIWWREMIRFVRARSRFITSLVQPMAWLILFGIGFSSSLGSSMPFAGSAGTTNYLTFLVPGVIGMATLFTNMSLSAGMSFMFDKEFGFLKEIFVAPVSRVAIVLGKALGGTTISLLQGFIILVVSAVIGIRITGPLGLPATLAFVVVVIFFIGMDFGILGISIASRLESIESLQVVLIFLVLPIFFLSGALFPLTSLPDWMKALAAINPLTYGIDALRYALIGAHEYPLALDFGVFVGFFLLSAVIGSRLFRNVR
ncbi:MAG: ABC transporter permease [Halobacteriota archaeon]